jgi:hypothetical protein
LIGTFIPDQVTVNYSQAKQITNQAIEGNLDLEISG